MNGVSFRAVTSPALVVMPVTCLLHVWSLPLETILRLRMIHSRKISLETLGLILLTLKFDWSP